MLDRQREFVADASHELRTPLTSVLANLELLTEELDGEQAETAEAALRSTRRMRRLVGDLLLLARADARRVQPHRAHRPGRGADRGRLRARADGRAPRAVDRRRAGRRRRRARRAPPPRPQPAGERRAPHAAGHPRSAPPPTRATARRSSPSQDDGPGHPGRSSSTRVFERFVRGGRDGGRGSGLGLAIVRAVAQSHGGTVDAQPAPERRGHAICDPDPSARRAQAADRHRRSRRSDLDDDRQDHRPAPQPVVDERRQIVVQLLLEQVDLPDAVLGGRGQRALDLLADVGDQPVGLLDERHAAEDDLGRDDRLAGLLGDRWRRR